MQIIDQQVKWDEKTNQTTIITKYENEMIKAEPLTSEEASLWTAEHHF